jgi:hypothetical protein
MLFGWRLSAYHLRRFKAYVDWECIAASAGLPLAPGPLAFRPFIPHAGIEIPEAAARRPVDNSTALALTAASQRCGIKLCASLRCSRSPDEKLAVTRGPLRP